LRELRGMCPYSFLKPDIAPYRTHMALCGITPTPTTPSIGVGLAEYPEGGGERMRWPQTLYLTPPEWGKESHVLAEEEVQDVVRDLRDLGEEWKGISPDDLAARSTRWRVSAWWLPRTAVACSWTATPWPGWIANNSETMASESDTGT
jgi:hypothetical protein